MMPSDLGYNEHPSIIAPKGGWKDKTYYIVDVAFSKHNPIHRKIFYSGFTNNGQPGAYSGFGQFGSWEAAYESFGKAFYLRVIRVIDLNIKEKLK